MAKITYVERRFNASSLLVITQANVILEEYKANGYNLTLRQLYYQFVSRGLIANNIREYKKLGSIVNDARLAGEIDWDHIEDRTRNLMGTAHWGSPAEIVQTCAKQFRIDKWADQAWRVECWVEKDALTGVIERPCHQLDISYFACRGYVSQSEIHSAAVERFLPWEQTHGQKTLILHLGDHDPSGIDMSRDIQDRLRIFGCQTEVKRIALNMDQVREHNPPPNPAKLTDSRCEGYIEKFGDESWELDALPPDLLGTMIRNEVHEVRDPDVWEASEAREKTMRNELKMCSAMWPEVSKLLPKLNRGEDIR